MSFQEILQKLCDKLMKRLDESSGTTLKIDTNDPEFLWTTPSLLSVLETLQSQGKINFSLLSDDGDTQEYFVEKIDK